MRAYTAYAVEEDTFALLNYEDKSKGKGRKEKFL
jgi:hypothetical protein